MPKPVTILIQLEPDSELSAEYLIRCLKAMFTACLEIESLGYVRCEMRVGKELYTGEPN